MTNQKPPLLDYNRQCLTCNLENTITNVVHGWFDEHVESAEVSRRLFAEYNILISRKALSNHRRFHVKKTTTPSETPRSSYSKVPKGWEARVDINGDTGEVTSTPQKNDRLSDFSQILEEFNIDPDEFEIDGPARLSKWQTFHGDWLTAYKFRIRKKNEDTFDLPTLLSEVRAEIRLKPKTIQPLNPNRTVIVPFADLQAGKVGSRGDSKDLLHRTTEKRDKLEDYVKKWTCSSALFLDGGDIVESFENTAQQGFTNDLSIMQQLDLAGTIEQEFISMLSKYHDSVEVAGVPSNHGAWRKGKDILGRPSDDWGLFLLKQIEKAYALNPQVYGNVRFTYPDEWRKSLNIEVQGTGIGLVHGEDSSLAQMENWWAKQVHGASPIAQSDILISNHYHTFGIKPSGRSLRTGNQKYWISTPTLDNGSDWWANKSGSDSDPGLIAFVVEEGKGLDLSSFTVL